MSENKPVTAQTPREDSFDTAVRGYNRQQVLEYMSRSSQLLATLEQHLVVARADVQRARSEAERAQAEADALRAAPEQAKPAHEEVSARLSQILRLAAEEADQERATAEEEIAKLRAETQAAAAQMLEQARAEAERDLAEARETAERELADARATAEEELRAAHEEAERIQLASEQQAAALLDDAQRRAGAVNEVSDQRLETLTATHGEAVLRLGQIRDVLADLLERDAAAGSLADVVELVMAPAGTQPELDSRPEIEDGGQLDSEPVDEPVVTPEDDRDDQGQPTSIVPAVAETAVHEPIDAAVIDAAVIDAQPVQPGPVQSEPVRPESVDAELAEDDAPAEAEPVAVPAAPTAGPQDREIDLRDGAVVGERGVPTGR